MEDTKLKEHGHSALSGCSPFFLNSSALSLFNGRKSRRLSKENAIADEKFQEELRHQRELYEDGKEAEETAFKLWLKDKQREFTRIENAKKLENDLQKADLQMFFKDWPLQISIEAINDKRKKSTSKFLPFNVIVGKHSTGDARDPISQLYSSIVDEIKSSLKKVGIIESNIYRFKDRTTVKGGAALANIYSMMSTLPSIIIIPQIDARNKLYRIFIGAWTQDSLFPIQKEAILLDFDPVRISLDKDYLNSKLNEIKASYITISAVMNDAYSLVEGRLSLHFPDYAIQNQFISVYPDLIEYAKNEYLSLLTANKGLLNIDSSLNPNCLLPYDSETQDRIDKLLNNAIENLKQH